jgi:ketosteroid isomerase-like protein
MRRLPVLFLAIAFAFAQKPSDQSAEITIRALERQWTEAQSQNDNRALNLIFDNAMVYVEYGKLVSKAEYLSRIKQATPAEDEIVMESATVHTFGNTAIVVGSYREQQRKPGHKSIMRWRFVDTWVYKTNGWVLVAAGSTLIR